MLQCQSHVTIRKDPHVYLRQFLEAKAKQAAEKEKRNTERDLENENGGGCILCQFEEDYI
ncbi:unnamed protein product [Prunus armeniaca]|uniref:Uncharacterized protein n=1 Tax=Prunus armeniaca TaxID=36596 RepID=A0A6J5X846_PRUAR|nr:unnamed protein product [Prunus armeniaca]